MCAALCGPRNRSGLRGRAACPTSCATLQAGHGGCATWHTCLAAARIGKHGERGRPWGLPLGLSSVDTPGVYPERFLYGDVLCFVGPVRLPGGRRSEEHTSELQSLMRISYAVFCLKQKITNETDARLQRHSNYNVTIKQEHDI